MKTPVIAYAMHCSCGHRASKSLAEHAAKTLDGFYHVPAGWTVGCASCGDFFSVAAAPKSLCESWAKRHKSLGCTR